MQTLETGPPERQVALRHPAASSRRRPYCYLEKLADPALPGLRPGGTPADPHPGLSTWRTVPVRLVSREE